MEVCSDGRVPTRWQQGAKPMMLVVARVRYPRIDAGNRRSRPAVLLRRRYLVVDGAFVYIKTRDNRLSLASRA